MMTSLERAEPTAAEKLALLERVLNSAALGRSDQLRQMLRFVVSEEVAGRGCDLTELSIGVRAFGRPPNYSPDSDSTVRTRAHELRKRLDDFYRTGDPGGWRIELPKGTYQPRFVRMAPAALAVDPPPPESRLRPQWRLGFLAGFLAATACALTVWAAVRNGWFPGRSEGAARVVWGSALDAGSTVRIALGTPLQFWVRDLNPDALPQNDPPFLIPLPPSLEAERWYQSHRSRINGQLYLHPNVHSPLWGESAGAVALAEFFASRSVHTELLPEYTIRPAALKEHNAVLIGRAEHNPSAQALAPRRGYAIRYVPSIREIAVVSAEGQVAFQRSPNINYGLATVLARKTGNGVRRIVLFSGINSDGTQAAVDYMTSPKRLEELVAALPAQGGHVPESFQIVVRSSSRDSLTLEGERVALHVLDPD